MKNENLNSDFIFSNNSALCQLVEELLSQDYSIKNSFNNKNLDKIKEIILLEKKSITENSSYEKSKEGLILILQELELSGWETIPKKPLNVLFDIKSKPSDSGVENDFYSIYLYFKEEKSLPFNENIVHKLLGQQLSLSLGWLGQKALHVHLSLWWPTRESSISLLLNPEKDELQIHPDLSTALNRLAILHRDILGDPLFPTHTVENSLRYILSVSKVEEFVPAPLEVGYLLLFFGQQDFLERFLHNSLNIKGIEADEIVDFSFRMIRTQRLKSKAFSQNLDFTKQDLEIMEEDHEALKQLLHKLKLLQPVSSSEAA